MSDDADLIAECSFVVGCSSLPRCTNDRCERDRPLFCGRCRHDRWVAVGRHAYAPFISVQFAGAGVRAATDIVGTTRAVARKEGGR
jgi:hypothetical protein